MDGRKQRQALSAAESALRALAAGDGTRARSAAAKAAVLDQIGSFATLEAAVASAADDLSGSGSISDEVRAALSDAVGPGPLAAMVADLP